MEAITLTGATLFWFIVPMPLLIVWAIYTYVKEGRSDFE